MLPPVSVPSPTVLTQLSALYGSDSESSREADEDSCEAPSKRCRTEAIAADGAHGTRGQLRTPQEDASRQLTLPPPPLDDDEEAAHTSSGTWFDGRVRQLEHVDGHFAVHVFVPVSLDATRRSALERCALELSEVRSHSRERVHALNPSEYHISLSRTAMLPKHELDGFTDALRVALQGCAPFHIPLSGSLCELANDNRTRFFAAIECGRARGGQSASGAVIDAVDAVFARYQRPPFYKERRLHFSIAWSLAPLPPLVGRLPTAAFGVGRADVLVDGVCCRIGERTTVLKLAGGGCGLEGKPGRRTQVRT
jgi:hypothetical protein